MAWDDPLTTRDYDRYMAYDQPDLEEEEPDPDPEPPDDNPADLDPAEDDPRSDAGDLPDDVPF